MAKKLSSKTKTSKVKQQEKICPICNRAFSWRKKWERDWENVIYCSKACMRKK